VKSDGEARVKAGDLLIDFKEKQNERLSVNTPIGVIGYGKMV